MSGNLEKWNVVEAAVRSLVTAKFGGEYHSAVRSVQNEEKIAFVVDMKNIESNGVLIRLLARIGVSDAVNNPKTCDGIAVFTISENERESCVQKLKDAARVAERFTPQTTYAGKA